MQVHVQRSVTGCFAVLRHLCSIRRFIPSSVYQSLVERYGPSSPLPKKGAEPPSQFSAHVYCSQTSFMYQDATWYRGRPQPRRHCVRWEPSSPSHKRAQLSQFLANVHCGQRLDGLRCHLVWRYVSAQATLCLMGIPLPQKKGTAPYPIFGPGLLWPSSWMDQGATWYGGKPRPRRHCVRCGCSSRSKAGQPSPPPVFGPCLLWPNG